MAGETLQTAAQLLEGFPDNTAQLIRALNNRNNVVSSGVDLAFVSETFEPPVVISPTLDPADTIVNSIWTPSAAEAFRFWQKDGNGRLSNKYADSVTVNPGTTRLVDIVIGGIFRRQDPLTPPTFGGIYRYQYGDGAPGAGDIDGNSNLTQHQVSHTTDDAVDLTAQWQSLQPDDIVNISGVLYRIITIVDNGAYSTFTHDPIARQEEDTAQAPGFTQGLGSTTNAYRFHHFKDGVATGSGLLYDIGRNLEVVAWINRVTLDDYFDQSLWDLRCSEEVAGSPDLECIYLAADIRGTLL